MNERPSIFGLLFLPGILAGMLLAAVALEMGRAAFPDALAEAFPNQKLLVLLVAIAATCIVGLVSLFFPSRENEANPQQDVPRSGLKNKNGVPSGDNHAR